MHSYPFKFRAKSGSIAVFYLRFDMKGLCFYCRCAYLSSKIQLSHAQCLENNFGSVGNTSMT